MLSLAAALTIECEWVWEDNTVSFLCLLGTASVLLDFAHVERVMSCIYVGSELL